MMKNRLVKTTALSVLSLALLLPTTSAFAYDNNIVAPTHSSIEVNDIQSKKNDIKAQLESSKPGSSSNFDELSKYLTAGDIEFIHSIINFKQDYPELTNQEVVDIVFPVDGGIQTFGILESAGATWSNLTTAEKWLVAGYPAEALIVKAAQSNTDELVVARYGKMVDGDKANAFRHALWNAIMALNIGKALAESFATAHEDHGLTDNEYKAQNWNGFNGLQHKEMDLHNNAKGRDCVSWYELPYFVTNTDLADGVQEKIKNNEMKILVK